MNRRIVAVVTSAVVCAAALAPAAAEPTPAPAAVPPSARPRPPGPEPGVVSAAVDRSLLFLARQQRPDGLFTDGPNRLALSGLGLLAFLAAGYPDDDGRYGTVVARVVDALAAEVPPDGYLGKIDNSRMYGQAIVCLALAEAAGVTGNEDRRDRLLSLLRRAVPVLLAAQDVPKQASHAGGWRYEPTSTDSDLSLSVWCVQALLAARAVGIDIPEQSLLRARAYILQCRTPTGGFAYQPQAEQTASSTGAGTLTLLLLNPPPSPPPPELAPALDQLAAKPIRFEDRFAYYALHNVVAAAHHAGEPLSSGVSAWAVPLLLSLQQPDGGFPASRSGEEPGRIYATAIATLSLAIPTSPVPTHRR